MEQRGINMWNNAVNKECLEDLAKIILEHENFEIDDSEFRRKTIDRIYELDDPRDILDLKEGAH